MPKISEITSGKGENEISTCWIAGSNLKQNALFRTYKRDEINGIDIPELCDKLRSLNEKNSRSVGTDCDSSSHVSPQLSFRVYNRLVFGALAILREQVNYLFDDTNRLLETTMNVFTTNDHTQGFDQYKKNLKRKLCLPPRGNESRVSFKKLRKDEVNYSTLLDEAELLINMDPITFSQENRKIQAREKEITLREFSEDVDSAVCLEPLDGFGIATTEELLTLIDMFADSTGGMGRVRENLKRRLVDEYEAIGVAKKMKLFSINNISIDANIELVRNTEVVSNDINFHSIELDLCADMSQEICPRPQSHASTILDASLDALPSCSNFQNESLKLTKLKLSPLRLSRRNRKLLRRPNVNRISEIKLSQMQMICQSTKYLAMIEREYYKTKEKLTLTKCPLNHAKPCKLFPNMFKNWTKPSFQQISNEYINLVKEIMGCDYNAKMVDEIALQSISSVISQRRLENCPSIPPFVASYQAPISLSQSSVPIELKSNVDDFENDFILASNPYFGEITKGPAYATMLQLLKFCIEKSSYKVKFRKFVSKMSNRIEAALAFHNLLGKHNQFFVAASPSCFLINLKALVRDGFIQIQTKPGQSEAVSILLCEKSENLFDVLKQSRAKD